MQSLLGPVHTLCFYRFVSIILYCTVQSQYYGKKMLTAHVAVKKVKKRIVLQYSLQFFSFFVCASELVMGHHRWDYL